MHQACKTAPERFRGKPRSGQHPNIHKMLQDGGDFKAMAVNEIGHFVHLHHTVFIRLLWFCAQLTHCAPALATCASCSALTPETPTAPITCPSTKIGTPPSSEVSNGADKKAYRPPLTMSS